MLAIDLCPGQELELAAEDGKEVWAKANFRQTSVRCIRRKVRDPATMFDGREPKGAAAVRIVARG